MEGVPQLDVEVVPAPFDVSLVVRAEVLVAEGDVRGPLEQVERDREYVVAAGECDEAGLLVHHPRDVELEGLLVLARELDDLAPHAVLLVRHGVVYLADLAVDPRRERVVDVVRDGLVEVDVGDDALVQRQ